MLGHPQSALSSNRALTLLADFPCRILGMVHEICDACLDDPIARRLRDVGFVAGEPVEVVTRAPFGGDPLVVQIGFTRFALRRAEAARIVVKNEVYPIT